MLSSLREKFLSVSLFRNSEEPKKHLVNINAGSEILTHFQTQWEELHIINEENASEATKVASEIEKLSNNINNNKNNMVLINQITTISNLPTNINKCLETIKELHDTTETLEKKLIQLENLIDQADFEKLKNRHKYHLQQYEQRKEESLKAFKSALDARHLKKLEEYETSKKAVMKERQQVFQDAFKNDLETYKNLGTIPPKIQHTQQNGALLEEIQLDFDQNELDQFFNEDKSNNIPI